MNSGNVFAQAAGSFGQSTHHAMKAVHGMTFLLHLCQGNQELAIRLFGATGNLDQPTIREVFAQACREKGELALLNLEATSSANFKKILEGKIGEGPGCLLLKDFAVKGSGKSSTSPPNLAQILQLLDAIIQVYRLLIPGPRNLIQLGFQPLLDDLKQYHRFYWRTIAEQSPEFASMRVDRLLRGAFLA